MINPSTQGWIEKFLNTTYSNEFNFSKSELDFYCQVRDTGFIYGYVTSLDVQLPIQTVGWTTEEFSKVALLNTLFKIYHFAEKDKNFTNFIKTALDFYDNMHPKGFSFFSKILPTESQAVQLEKIIDSRVQTNDNIISKNFSHIITNALLFIDVLAFHQYLTNKKLAKDYVQKLEETIVSVVAFALKIKTKKTQYDDLLIKLFETSVRYTKLSDFKISELNAMDFSILQNNLEKYYVLDLASMAIWSDAKMEPAEYTFLNELGNTFNLQKSHIEDGLYDIDAFIHEHKDKIPYFNYSNPIKHFYDQASQNVINLITRNKKRLQKELSESKDLVKLLAISTTRELNIEEKKKVKKQLLDVCKTVPSLTIFLLPGGSLLLPLLIKFIPQLLPSAFNENLD